MGPGLIIDQGLIIRTKAPDFDYGISTSLTYIHPTDSQFIFNLFSPVVLSKEVVLLFIW